MKENNPEIIQKEYVLTVTNRLHRSTALTVRRSSSWWRCWRLSWPLHCRSAVRSLLRDTQQALTKTSEHLVTDSNSYQEGLKTRSLKSCSAMLPEFLLGALRPLSSQ